MNRFDYYTGEPQQGSPYFNGSSNMQMQFVNDPNLRYQQTQTMQITPGGYGYNYYNQQPTQIPNKFLANGFRGNPALNMIQNGIQVPYYLQQQPQYQDRIVHVPGFNTGTNTIYPENFEEICSKLQLDMMIEMEEAIVERNKRFQGYFNNNYGYNYYGLPYYSNYEDQRVIDKYKKKVEEIHQEAVSKRLKLNKRLSKLCHGYINDGVSDKDIDNVYDGYSYTIPANVQYQSAVQESLANLKPVSNQNIYVEHHNAVKKMHEQLLDGATDMNSFLHAQGKMKKAELIEEEMHRRKDGSQYYQVDAYKRFLRKSIMERNGKVSEQPISVPQQLNNGLLNQFPTLNNSGTLLEDGTLSITAPPWLGNRQIVLNNQLEQHFEENRHKFLQSIYAQNLEE